MPSPTIDWITPQNGQWIIPAINGIWDADTQIRIADQGQSEGRDISGEVITVPSRQSKIVVQGETHNVDGVLTGIIEAYGGVTALEYMERLHDLITNQHRHTIIVVKRGLYIANARFHTRYDFPRREGTDLYDVSLPYVSLTD